MPVNLGGFDKRNQSYANGFSLGQVTRGASLPEFLLKPSQQPQRVPNNTLEEILRRATNIKNFESPTTYQYPFKLEEREEFVHSVIFYINARSNSRVGASALTNYADNRDFNDAQTALREQTSKENRADAEFAQNVVSGSIKAAIALAAVNRGVSLGKTVTGIDASSSGRIINTLAATILTTGTAFVGADPFADFVGRAATDVTSTVRLLSAIELYVSAPPSAEYAAEWQNVELGVIGGLLSQGFKVSLENMMANSGPLGEFTARSIIQAAAAIPRELGISGDLGGAIEATSKKVANPYKEQLFKNMGFRSFGFSYKFNPRNKNELDSVMEIIQLFKYHMHPEIDPARLYLIYPSEFNIEYRYKGERNEYIHKISTCALTNVRVTYGSSDFTTFSGTGGAPSEINLDLTFSELETLDNSRIGQKWDDSY